MTKVDDKSVEPGFLMAPPLVAYAIHEGILEKDGLIFVQKEGYNKSSCKKPIDVLRDKDEQGLRAIARLIGKRQSLEFLRKEGISPSQDLSSEQIISGVGYTIEKEKMLALYTKYVADEFQSMFPFVVQDSAIVKGKKGYELVPARETHGIDRLRTDEHEWTVPNVVNLTMREAVEKLVMHTSRIRVYGNGKVVEQNPRAFERTRGDTECVIYGSTAR